MMHVNIEVVWQFASLLLEHNIKIMYYYVVMYFSDSEIDLSYTEV